MVDFFKRKHVQILKYLLPEDISVQDKFCNLIYVSTLIGSIGTLIVSMFLTPSSCSFSNISGWGYLYFENITNSRHGSFESVSISDGC